MADGSSVLSPHWLLQHTHEDIWFLDAISLLPWQSMRYLQTHLLSVRAKVGWLKPRLRNNLETPGGPPRESRGWGAQQAVSLPTANSAHRISTHRALREIPSSQIHSCT